MKREGPRSLHSLLARPSPSSGAGRPAQAPRPSRVSALELPPLPRQCFNACGRLGHKRRRRQREENQEPTR
eukprot:13316250-Alexandrium_andersonii.AAC.1